MPTPAEILTLARSYLEKGVLKAEDASARDEQGNRVGYADPTAARWSPIGAVFRARDDLGATGIEEVAARRVLNAAAQRLLSETRPGFPLGTPIADYCDALDQAGVLLFFELAIAEASVTPPWPREGT